VAQEPITRLRNPELVVPQRGAVLRDLEAGDHDAAILEVDALWFSEDDLRGCGRDGVP
jgi:hypothetical protein